MVSPVLTVIVGPGYCPLMTRPVLEKPSIKYFDFVSNVAVLLLPILAAILTRGNSSLTDCKVVNSGDCKNALPTKTSSNSQNQGEFH